MSSPAKVIEAVLEESGPEYGEFTFETPLGGHQSEVYLVTLTHEGETYDVVVKFKPPEMDSFAIEPKMHEYVKERTDVPIPDILVYEEDPDLDVPPYFVTARLQGDNLAEVFSDLDMETRCGVVAQAGRILGNLHSEIAFEAFGYLDLYNGRITVRNLHGSWREYFEDLTTTRIDEIETTPFDDLAPRARAALEPSLDRIPDDAVPRLVHDDFRPSNLLVSPERSDPITAVLDWQDVLAAPPEYSLAQTEFMFIDSSFDDPSVRRQLRKWFRQDYQSEREFDFDEEYEARRPIYQLSTLLWRMCGFTGAFEDESSLRQARAEARYRREFERLVDDLPEA